MNTPMRRRVANVSLRAQVGLSMLAVIGACVLAGASPAAATTTPDPSASGSATPGASDGQIPVAGTFGFHGQQQSGNARVSGAVHSVRRVEGGTAVYYSVGFAAGSRPLWIGTRPNSGLKGYGPYDMWSVALVDTKALKYYAPMKAATGCLCSKTVDLQSQGEAGVLLTGFAVMPELPATVTTVSVNFGFGSQVENVPVEQGALTPESTNGKSVSVLGEGWPVLPDAATIASVTDQKPFIYPLTSSIADLNKTVTRKEQPGKVEVELAADVLFAVDKSALSPAAQSKLAAVAQDILKRGTGQVQIVGHTDSTGTTSHNRTLSQARAAAVLNSLKPKVKKAGVSFTSAGRGESDPVAGNDTADGRKLNRRVTISYSVGSPS